MHVALTGVKKIVCFSMIYRPSSEKVQRGSRHEEKTKMSAESESRERKIFIIVRNEGGKQAKRKNYIAA